MAPTIKAGGTVEADYAAFQNGPPKRDDIVVFFPPGGAASQRCGVSSEPADGRACELPTGSPDPTTKFIKRVVGLPGDWLYFQDNRTYVGKQREGPYVRATEPYIAPGSPCSALCNLRKPIQVPTDHFYVLGDNRGQSDDSRDWGPIPTTALLAKVLDGTK
jgi:signal peptidase I